MAKTIWLINQYAMTPSVTGDGHRHYYLAKEFKKHGYNTTIITSCFNHFKKKKIKIKGIYKLFKSDIDVVLLNSNSYKKTESIGRILSMFIFLVFLFLFPKKKLDKPDIIIVSSISLLPILYAVFYKISHPKCKFILEIRDIWPLTLIEVGNYSRKNIFIRFLTWIEKLGYRKADYITSLLKGTNEHIVNTIKKKDFNYEWISNGYYIDKHEISEKLSLDDQNRIPKNKFLVGYVGAIGNANAMEYIVEAFNKMSDTEDCVLCIVGRGDKKSSLMELSKRNNIVFFDHIPKAQVQAFLKEMDVLYVGSKKSSLYKFGISANKIFDYMFAGKPILMSGIKENNPVAFAKAGIIVEPENIELLKEQVLELKTLKNKELNLMGQNGYDYLIQNFTYEVLAKKYVNIFQKLC